MGLIKAAVGAIGGTLHEQWQDLIKCEDMGNDILMVKKTTKSGQISKGSRIIVGPSQVAVIYDSGRILDATAEEGVYDFDESSSPSFFGGNFGAVFKEMWQRFTYNGTPAKEQAVFYFNTKEILDNKFGTATPIPFQDWSHAIPNQMTGTLAPMGVKVRCYGKYTFRIDPEKVDVFLRNHAGTADVVTKDLIVEQMDSEVKGAFQNVLNELGNSSHKVPVLELPSNTDEIKKIMDEKVFDEPIRARGIKLVGFTIESVSLDEDSDKKISQYEMSSNSFMQQGAIIGAMSDAANNANGAANGFMGVGMVNMATGTNMMGQVSNNAFQSQGASSVAATPVDPYARPQEVKEEVSTTVPAPEKTICTNCGKEVIGKFCSECGTPVQVVKKCSNCGMEVHGNFCGNCGTKVE